MSTEPEIKMNRRMAIGAMIGGAAAAPQIAGEIAAGPGTSMFGSPGDAGAKLAAERAWRQQQLARLKRLAAGNIQPEDMMLPREFAPLPYSELRSVSENGRYFMRARLQERRWRERIVAEAKKALADYDATGILRHVL